MSMRLLDLFSGIGGFSYAAEKLIGGYETVAFCEMDEFCQKVLKKHWPQVPIFDDVRTLDAARLGRIDIVTGGYPCQPFSQAGRRQGEEDERHLWPEMLRIIKSCQPRYVVAENVAGHVTMGLDQVLTDLEDQGYTTRPIIVPACAKNAPHRRDRVWIIGQLMADTYKWQSRSGDESKSDETQQFEFSTDNTSERGIVANSNSRRSFEEHSSTINRENEGLRSKHESSGSGTKETRADVANSDSFRCRGGSCKGCSDCKRQILSTERKGREVGSKVEGCSQSCGTSRSVEQRVGNMADGISKGLLRHFDREPEHIPRVTKGEKDRAKKLKALGNSIVPQVAAEILLAIRISEESV